MDTEENHVCTGSGTGACAALFVRELSSKHNVMSFVSLSGLQTGVCGAMVILGLQELVDIIYVFVMQVVKTMFISNFSPFYVCFFSFFILFSFDLILSHTKVAIWYGYISSWFLSTHNFE